MEDVEPYVTETGESEADLADEDIREIEESIKEIDRGELISWENLKKQ